MKVRKSDATAGTAAYRGPSDARHTPAYVVAPVRAHASPSSAKPHAFIAPKATRSSAESPSASGDERPPSERRATPAGSVRTPVPTMFLTRLAEAENCVEAAGGGGVEAAAVGVAAVADGVG